MEHLKNYIEPKEYKMKGKLITFEGIEGCGKTTQIKLLSDYLSKEGHDVSKYHEPGSTRVGAEIRRILLHPDHIELCPNSELLLYYAARTQLISEKLIPDLDAGKLVLCDRYDDSSMAYQHYGRGLDLKLLNLLKGTFVKVEPDLTILLDVPVDMGLERSYRVTDEFRRPDRIESEVHEFHERVRHGYLEMAKAEPKRFKVIDGNLPEHAVFAAVYQHVFPLLNENKKK